MISFRRPESGQQTAPRAPMHDRLQARCMRAFRVALWAECRARFGEKAEGKAAGPFLYGAYSAADAMFTPVVTRLLHYQLPVEPETRAYMETILKHHAFEAWKSEALAEPWYIPHYEEGHTPVAYHAHAPKDA